MTTIAEKGQQMYADDFDVNYGDFPAADDARRGDLVAVVSQSLIGRSDGPNAIIVRVRLGLVTAISRSDEACGWRDFDSDHIYQGIDLSDDDLVPIAAEGYDLDAVADAYLARGERAEDCAWESQVEVPYYFVPRDNPKGKKQPPVAITECRDFLRNYEVREGESAH